MPPKGTYRAPSVKRALSILEMVAENSEGLGISEIARRLVASKGSIFGICRQLEAGGALVRDEQSKRYNLGPLVTALASRGSVFTRLRQIAGPELTLLRDRAGESIFLGVLSRGEVTVVDARQPAGRMGIAAGPGTRLPLTAGAVGKALMAGLPPSRVDKILEEGLPAYTAGSVTDPNEFRGQLEAIRRQGCAMESDEYLVGMWGVAVGLGAASNLPAAIWAAGFTSSLETGHLERVAELMKKSAARVVAALGGPNRAIPSSPEPQ